MYMFAYTCSLNKPASYWEHGSPPRQACRFKTSLSRYFSRALKLPTIKTLSNPNSLLVALCFSTMYFDLGLGSPIEFLRYSSATTVEDKGAPSKTNSQKGSNNVLCDRLQNCCFHYTRLCLFFPIKVNANRDIFLEARLGYCRNNIYPSMAAIGDISI